MTISTLIHREGMADIPIEVTVNMNNDESMDCEKYGTITKPYWNDAMTYQVYDIGDQIYLTDEEMDQVKIEARDQVFESMSPSQRRNYESEQFRESMGYE